MPPGPAVIRSMMIFLRDKGVEGVEGLEVGEGEEGEPTGRRGEVREEPA